MDSQSFQARRREDLLAGDERLGPIVEEALSRRPAEDWFEPIVEEAARLWVEFHQAEAPGANFQSGLARFRESLADSLAKTGEQTNPGRVTRWATTFTVNDGTATGAYARGIRFKMWRTMRDGDVREVHERVDGQLRPIGGLFDLDGVRMPYPGAPVGPGEYWAECRCVVQPASREGEAMSASTFALDPDAAPAPQDPATYTGLVLVLQPVAGDPVVAASSEPAHMTVVWMGEAADQTDEALAAMREEVAAYAAELDGPIIAPVTERGVLGDEGADVAFLEATESLVAFRDGLLAAAPTVRAAMESVEQYPEWTPHVTLGYPETPARAEYDGDAIAFDRVGLWVGGEQEEFPMNEALAAGGIVEGREPITVDNSYVVPKAVMEELGLSEARIAQLSLVAAGEGAGSIEPIDDEEMPVDELEDDEEEITEIPVHGVATIEGKPTGDGRMFARGALTHRNLPLPLRLEIVGTHGGTTSDVVTVGRIDEMWREEGDEYDEYRYRGVIITTKEYASQAIEGIVDRSLTGVSVETDATIRDAEHGEAQDALMARLVDGERLSAEEEALLNLDVYSESRVCGFTIVPIPAFQEAYINLGPDFASDMTEDALAACAECAEKESMVVDLTELSAEELAVYDEMSPQQQERFAEERNLIVASAAGEGFAPGTKDGEVGTLDAWSSRTSGTPTSSTRASQMTSAGRGPAMSTAKDMAGSQSTATAVSDQPTGSFTSDSSGRSSPEEFSTTSATTDRAARVARLASIVDAAIHDTSSPSLTPTISSEDKRTTLGGAASAERVSMTSAFSRIESESPKGSGRAAGAATPTSDASRSVQRNADTESASATFAPGTRDGPGWITHPVPTGRIRRYWTRGKGAAKIRWGAPGDFNRCRKQLAKYIANPDWLAGACANMHKEALGVWPGQESGGRHALLASGATAAPLFNLAAAAIHEFPAEWFKLPQLDDPRVGVVVDGDRVYGYVAQWGVCHIGIDGVCTTPPVSSSNYAYFATGYVHTDDGQKVRVGQITIDTGHANLRSSAKVAAAHYDNTGAAAADIAVGEDAFGIWFAGALRPSITDDQRHALEASGRLSGDWRGISGGGLEMIAALTVNVPGFPIPAQPGFAASAAGQTALVAAGIVLPIADSEEEGDPADGAEANLDFAADVVVRVLDTLDARAQAQSARDRLHNLRRADARRRLTEGK